ncbi:glutamine-hydrolyzing carbamoyl-phosphate synthase small subunit [Oecophyllibacter saccharovorans]|uniref:glutamine-hydrolyzing carbamoyl-phosphate synthase small subunit n=1 Tax=Oecophyllibacter saccharovorans TaxID=2558360 RepID=UPI001167B09C|nr:glutamine-hydrolyzing carbamoyl-phosphate synthase small subunit [Oecophyllibacter saccharovorans]TPW34961.1 glutamine-hydrolyzing carbamoyl-phosphate synthase small subunit [Oecophyllibacter saccharovorans]
MNIDALIEKTGGPARIAQLTGVGSEAVRKWRQAGTVPPKHWPALLQLPGITLADLTADLPEGNTQETDRPQQKQNLPASTPDLKAGPQSGAEETLPPAGATAVLVLADGTVLWGKGFGACNEALTGELCFCTAMTGYQETLTDPSFAGQIVTFTFPHIGNVGTNPEDDEASRMVALGAVVKEDVTLPANWRATEDFRHWLKARGRSGISGIDTRRLTRLLRDKGPQTAVLSYPETGKFDIPALLNKTRQWPGLQGMDLAAEVSRPARSWDKPVWTEMLRATNPSSQPRQWKRRVVALDYGAKDNILRCLVSAGCEVEVLPATASGAEILAMNPEGVFLSNGPGDPAATAQYAVPAIQAVLEAGIPIFGICLGHQLLARAFGGSTYKLPQGHRGANQPVKDLTTGKVEITSQNHGFAVDENSLPQDVTVTHVSLFDGTNEGIAHKTRPAFSVQYHPEASPGPTDSFYLFERFVSLIDAQASDNRSRKKNTPQNDAAKGA